MRKLLPLLLVLGSTPALAAPGPSASCAAPTRRTDLDEALGRAEVAVGALDLEALGSAVDQAETALACLADPIDAPGVARYYRALGVRRFATGDEAGAVAAFRAARALQPAWQLDPGLGAPVKAAWDSATPPADTWNVPLPVPAEGWLQVDGRRTSTAPDGRAYVLQWFDGAGAVRLTAAVAAGAWPPPYPMAAAGASTASAASAAPAVSAPLPAPVTEPASGGHASRGLLATGIAALVAGGASIAGSAAMQHAFLEGDAPSSDRQGLVTGNRVLGYGGAGLGAAGLALGVGAVVVGRW